MRFLRTRLFIATFGVTTLILLGAGLLLHFTVRASVIAEFDESLLARAQALASLVEQEGDQFEVEFQSEQMPGFADPVAWGFIAIITRVSDGEDRIGLNREGLG